ncbi:tRNA (mnm(5)s(2)U34)-methyltransferase [Thiohalorhabdus sp. Cl-TMA]|uniref:Class I SAM-dependent methyltransferase n=1 Tax=Thiohalorhabdus methylotrophus TaxID=3242694 RepID=A0ABV4TV70_9GAMM
MAARGAVARAHRAVAECLYAGAWAVDATVGNGHDTLFLAQMVGEGGRVDGVDTQTPALSAARARLAEAGVLDRVRLHQGGHERLPYLLPGQAAGRVQAVMFNLGFLPGGEKTLITRPETTLAALDASIALLAPEGRLSVVAYPGHPGGAEECAAVMEWAEGGSGKELHILARDAPEESDRGVPRMVALERIPF